MNRLLAMPCLYNLWVCKANKSCRIRVMRNKNLSFCEVSIIFFRNVKLAASRPNTLMRRRSLGHGSRGLTSEVSGISALKLLLDFIVFGGRNAYSH